MFQYMNSLGLAPFLNSSWDEKNFDAMELFDKEPTAAIDKFLNHNVGKCPHPQNKTQEVVCLKSFFQPVYPFVIINEILKQLKINKSIVEPTVQKIEIYSLKKVRCNVHSSCRLI